MFPGRPFFLKMLGLRCIIVYGFGGFVRHIIAAIMIIAATSVCLSAYDGPVVVDDANFLGGDQLMELIYAVESANASNEFFLVILTVPSLDGQPLDKYAKAILGFWGIGREGRDDGLLLLIVKDELIFHFETGKLAKTIIDSARVAHVRDVILKPFFVTQKELERPNYLPGLIDAVKELGAEEPGPSLLIYLWVIPPLLILVFIFANTLNRKRRSCPHCGKSVSPIVSRCPHCLGDVRVRNNESCPCGSKKIYEDCCLDQHTDGRDSHRIQFLRKLDIRYLMWQSTSFGGYTGGGTYEIPEESSESGNFDGKAVIRGF